MSITELAKVICGLKGVDTDKLEGKTLADYLEAYAAIEGVDTDGLPDRLVTTYLAAVLKKKGQSVSDNLITTQLEALAKSYGAGSQSDKLISTYLKAIIDELGTAVEFEVTGDETFNYQAADNTVYFKKSSLANLTKKDFVNVKCTHFAYGKGAVIADMEDGEFIFNYTKSTGLTTGNVSFKRDDLFDSSATAKAWFKQQKANGRPVIITCYVKGEI